MKAEECMDSMKSKLDGAQFGSEMRELEDCIHILDFRGARKALSAIAKASGIAL